MLVLVMPLFRRPLQRLSWWVRCYRFTVLLLCPFFSADLGFNVSDA